MRLYTLLKKVFLKLGLIADYIVETGTSGIWTYRKWNSGRFDAFTKGSVNGQLKGSLMGGYYSRATLSTPKVMISEECLTGLARLGTGGGFISWHSFSGNNLSFDVVGNQNDASIKYNLYIIGKWK